MHVFGDPARYPLRAGSIYAPQPEANLDALLATHRAIGITHGTFVQPTGYGTDHRLLLDALARAHDYRGIAIVDDSVSDAELAELDAAGVRGARFNFWKFLNIVPDHNVFLRSVDRIRELGWHVRIHAVPDELQEIVDLLDRVRVPIVIDHMANLDVSLGVDHPGARFVLEAIQRGWWIMVSNGDRFSKSNPPWSDVVPLGKALIAAAPDRVIWGSDWPHLRPVGDQSHDDAAILELLYSYAPELEIRRNILVSNPARLLGMLPAG